MTGAALAGLALKLLLVAAALLLASLAARRSGHAMAGLLSGLPMVVGPVLGLLLLDGRAAQAQAMAAATLVCLPAMLLHSVVFAALAQRGGSWPRCMTGATLAFAMLATGLLTWRPPVGAAVLLALGLPSLATWGLQRQADRLQQALHRSGRVDTSTGAVAIPNGELGLRIAAAVALAATVLAGAPMGLPDTFSGALLALPIAGSVLPCFTLPRHGALATVRLLAGFARGLHGMVAYTTVMALGLDRAPPALVWPLGMAAAVLAAAGARRLGPNPCAHVGREGAA